ncbi:MAG: PDC sensor domain-containing protein [Deltaproteobacteria bacterium]|nr:PDC sensor domain-containing protein [Deltaproteobacteria bacterium]
MSLVCLGSLLGLAACEPNQTVNNVWKDTKAYYREYLNTSAVLELQDISEYQDYLLTLGSGMAEIDEELRQLSRVLDDSDRGTDTAWALAVLKRFPWLSGLAILDADGAILARVPEYSLKEFDASPLLEEDPKQRRSNLRAYVQQSPLGPEIYLGKPVYVANEQRAVVLVHFDMRALLARHRKAAELVLATPQVMLWPGIYDIEATPLTTADWPSLVKNNVIGTLSNANGTFYWSYSFLANLPIIYAIPSEGAFPQRPEQMELLDYASAFAMPEINLAPEESQSSDMTDSDNSGAASEGADSDSGEALSE